MRPDGGSAGGEASNGVDGGKLIEPAACEPAVELQPSASGEQSAAAETVAISTSGGGSREASDWLVDGAGRGDVWISSFARASRRRGERRHLDWQLRLEPEAASGLAAAVSSATTTASSGVSRESAGWHVDGVADGAEGDGADGEATAGAASDGADGGKSGVPGLPWSLLRWMIGEGERLLLRDDDGE